MFILVALISMTSLASSFKFSSTRFGEYRTTFQVGYHEKSRSDVGTVLFLNGFSDRMRNHLSHFKQFKRQGLRVVSYDYPEHGGSGGEINIWDLDELAKVAGWVLSHTGVDHRKPLILAGYSTGGTIIVRILQKWRNLIPRKYDIAGAILYSPSIPVKTTAGFGFFGRFRNKDLSRGRIPYPPKPKTVFFNGGFANSLSVESRRASRNILPNNEVPVVVYMADRKEDEFNNVRRMQKWVKKNKRAGRPLFAFSCSGAYHAIQYEPGIGRWVNSSSASFGKTLAKSSRRSRTESLRSAIRSTRSSRSCSSF